MGFQARLLKANKSSGSRNPTHWGLTMSYEYTLENYETALNFRVREEPDNLPEQVVQQFWYDYGPETGALKTLEGHDLEVLSPGWWNYCAGPDFMGAQLRFNGTLYTGDVEVHLDQNCWRLHGHHEDRRYNDVLLHVLLNAPRDDSRTTTQSGRALPHIALAPLCNLDNGALRPVEDAENHPELAPRCHGSCNRFIAEGTPEILTDFLKLSGDWRLLNKTRYVEERMARVGADQAAWELLARALGYRPFADTFERLAVALPYDRARQLTHQEPFLLEAALLHLGALLPRQDEQIETLPPHGQRLAALRAQHFPQLNALDMQWPLAGVRPYNYPGRRIGGLAHVMGRLARDGFCATLDRLWKTHDDPVTLRRAFEALFPPAMGFWANHYRLDSPAMATPTAPVGTGRVRSIIGNVFTPLAMARARAAGQRSWEEQIWHFYRKLPMEPDNRIYKRMVPRVIGDYKMRFKFQTQQGLLQLHEDWCKTNPSCRHCALLAYLEGRAR